MLKKIIADAGFLFAYLSADDEHHEWAVTQFQRFPQFITCEAVLAEVGARLEYFEQPMTLALELVSAELVIPEFSLAQNNDRVLRLMEKYADQPMDMADACLVVMSEEFRDSQIVTVDSDFKVYRRHGREVIPLIYPKK